MGEETGYEKDVMAKNDAAYEAFLADLKAIAPEIEEALKQEKVSAKLREGVLARAEFSSQMDALKAERTKLEAWQTEERAKIEGWQNWYGETSKQVATVVDELKAYKEAYGELDATEKKKVAAQSGLSKEDFEKRLEDTLRQREVGYGRFVDVLTDIKIEHRDRFKEKLDTEALYKLAGEKNLPLDAAYNIYIGDRVEELRKTQVEERIKQEREAAVSEYVTKHNLPVISSNPDIVHPLDVSKPLTDKNERIGAAVSDFMKRAQR